VDESVAHDLVSRLGDAGAVTWQTADESVVRRLAERVNADGWAGHDGGDMPDSIWVLHAMYQHVDGLPVEPVVWTGDT
jgi:hypothetical protein